MKYILSILALSSCFCLLYAQKETADAKLPFNSAVRMGKLENGMTYYIQKNTMPEKRLTLRLVVDAGSILEDDDQLGIAHYTEHMAFNGSKNFAKNELVDYLQSVGVKFGSHLNAYTGFDQTVYILPIPSDSEEIVDKGFQILEDWAHNISFEKEEIEKEVGVITEEWRLGQGAQMRILKKLLPTLLAGSRYEHRLPIGKKDVFSKFTREHFLRFYRNWYRPDLMAVVAVGDMDVDEIEKKIKHHFSRIKMPEKVKERTNFSIPKHKGTRVAVVTDKEMPYTQIVLLFNHETTPFVTEKDYRERIKHSLFTMMMNVRLREITRQNNPPFIFSGVTYGNMFGVRGKDAYQVFAAASEQNILRATQVMVTENMRVKKHGFTKSELIIASKNLLKQYSVAYNERSKTSSKRFASEYVDHFLNGAPCPGIEYEYELHKRYIAEIKLEEVNALAEKWIKEDDNVVAVMAPEKPGLELPSSKQILDTITATQKEELEAYKEEKIDTELLKKELISGKIIEESKNGETETTHLLLANGIRVVLKPTEFKNDEILMYAQSPGGTSLLDDKDYFATTGMMNVLSESGLGNFSRGQLSKALAGKSVSVTPFIDSITEGLRGNASPDSFETLMQLTHLWFTQPRMDKDIFKATIDKEKAVYKNMAVDPNSYFNDQVVKVLGSNHPRSYLLPTEEHWGKLDHEKMLRVYKERFSNAGDFVFFFVGSFDVVSMKPLIEKYLGSLSGNATHENFKDLGAYPPEGVLKKSFYRGSAPRSFVNLFYSGKLEKYTSEVRHQMQSLAQVLGIRLIESLREEKGGVYSGGVRSRVKKYPSERYFMSVSFPCAPENAEMLIKTFQNLLKDVRDNGPLQKNVDKVIKGQLRELEVNLKRNEYWLSHLYISDFLGLELQDPAQARSTIESLKAEDLQKVAQKYFTEDNYIELVLYPENKEKESKEK
ncbi:M16 family metallopeptidase [Candidatus Uabimicrobium sp. HlEnr_7]|uniref:M16 family metallopeptidase n=1 Tax=Candidatus Uabimicrobium helgolandensis TaxID=3095367 RepID=UPI003557B78D